MQLISYVSQTFTNVPAVFDYLAANVPWLTANGDTLTAGNLTLEKSATTAIKITDSAGGLTITTPSVSNSNANYQILITDSAVIVGQNAITAFIIGKSTDGTNEHYGVIYRTSGTSAGETMLTYGASSAQSYRSRSILTATATTQFIPVYALETAYNIEGAFIVFMSTSPTYFGRMELNGAKYVQCGGLALQYTE
jgi:endoglucanase Acf2